MEKTKKKIAVNFLKYLHGDDSNSLNESCDRQNSLEKYPNMKAFKLYSEIPKITT